MTIYFDHLCVNGKPERRKLSPMFKTYDADIVWVNRGLRLGNKGEKIVEWLESQDDGDVYLHNYECKITNKDTQEVTISWPLYFGVEFTSAELKQTFIEMFGGVLVKDSDRNFSGIDHKKYDKPDEPHPEFGEGFFISYETGLRPRTYFQGK